MAYPMKQNIFGAKHIFWNSTALDESWISGGQDYTAINQTMAFNVFGAFLKKLEFWVFHFLVFFAVFVVFLSPCPEKGI